MTRIAVSGMVPNGPNDGTQHKRKSWTQFSLPTAARSTVVDPSQASSPALSPSAIDSEMRAVSEPRAVATGSMRNVDGTTQLTAFVSPPIIDPLGWLIRSLPLRVLTPTSTAHLDHIQPTRWHPSIAFRSTDISCCHETPMGSGRSSRDLLLSGHELHSPSSHSKLPQVSCWLRPLRGRGSSERSLSTTANLVSRTFPESLIHLLTGRAN